MTPDVQAIGRQFGAKGAFLEGKPYGNGHINDTYLTRWDDGGRVESRVQQRINHNVFKDPPSLMDNIVRVTSHIRRKLEAAGETDIGRQVLTCIPATDGRFFHLDGAGNYWRTYGLIDRATSYSVCTGPDLAYQAARAFGRFQMLLSDFPVESLHETIPWFHHTPRRFAALEQAIAKDAANRCAAARPEIDFALARKDMTPTVTAALEKGVLKPRVTHNDTKLNNVMIDDATGRGICVIDLDTVMPGSVLYDIGDLVRSSTITTVEDQQDLSKVDMDIARFEAIIRGYSETAGALLSAAEKDLLAFCGRLITFTIGIRFLADYLAGDVYFKTHRPDQNLERARVQFTMVRKMEERRDAMQKIVEKHCRAG